MSIGNLKDYGNKGNNFPFQLKVLQGITNILAVITGTSIVINPKVRTANIKRSIVYHSIGKKHIYWNTI